MMIWICKGVTTAIISNKKPHCLSCNDHFLIGFTTIVLLSQVMQEASCLSCVGR